MLSGSVANGPQLKLRLPDGSVCTVPRPSDPHVFSRWLGAPVDFTVQTVIWSP